MASGSDRNPIIIGGLPSQVPDFDPEETSEWLDSLDAAIDERFKYFKDPLPTSTLIRVRTSS